MTKKPTEDEIHAVLSHNATFHGGSRQITFRGMDVIVPYDDLRIAVSTFKKMNRRQRLRILANVVRSIDKQFPAIKDGTASTDDALTCAQDVAIWFANEVVEGRASLLLN